MKKSLLFIPLLAALTACEKQTSQDHLNNAQQALDDDKYEVAVIELKNAVRLNPEDASIRFVLGQTYFELGRYPEAEKELQRALDGRYAANEVIPLLSKVYQRVGDNSNLFKLSAKAKGLKAQDIAQLKLYQLQAYVAQGNDSKAQATLAELKQIPQGGVYKQLALSYEFIINQQFDNALANLEQVLLTYPNQPDTLKLLAQLQLNTQQVELAVSTYQTYIEAFPKDVDIKFLLARLYIDLRQPENAEPIVEELLEDYPKQPILLQLKASARANQQDHEQAYVFAEQALSSNPEDTPSRLIAGVSAYFLSDLENSNRHLSLIVPFLPSHHIALRFLADTQVRLGLTLEANDTVQRFEQLTEQDVGLLSEVGLALLRKGEQKKAQAILDKQPTRVSQPHIQASIAQLKLSLDDLSGILDLEQALANSSQQLDSKAQLNSKQIETTLAQAYFSNGQFDKVLDIAKRWQQSEDKATQAKGYVMGAKAHVAQSNTQLAIAAYQQALTLEPDSAGMALALIPLLHPDLPEQLSAIDQLLKQHPENLPIILRHYLTTTLLKQPERMTGHLQSLIHQYPSNLAFKLTLAKMQLLEQQPNKAIALFEQVKQHNSNTPASFWQSLAQAYIQTKQLNKAIAVYRQWFEIEPNHPQSIVGMIKAHHVQGQTSKALDLANQYINEVRDDLPQVQLLRLYLLAQLQQYAALQHAINELPTEYHGLPFVHGLQGQLLLSQNSEKEAEKALPKLQMAYNAIPSPVNTQWLYRAIAQTQGQAAAITFLQHHVGQHSKDESSTLALAQLITASSPAKAMALYQTVTTLNSGNFIAHNNIANLLVKQGDYLQAYTHALTAFELQPHEGPVLDTIGSIELKLNKNKSALTHMQAAVDSLKEKVNDQVMLNYLDALLRNKQNALARRKAAQYHFSTTQGQTEWEQLQTEYKL